MIAAWLYAVAVGDAAIASAIAGIFGLLNTGLTVLALRWLNQGRHEIRTTYSTAAHAAAAAESAAEGALEACRVAKSIGAAIRHEDPLIVKREPPPEISS